MQCLNVGKKKSLIPEYERFPPYSEVNVSAILQYKKYFPLNDSPFCGAHYELNQFKLIYVNRGWKGRMLCSVKWFLL